MKASIIIGKPNKKNQNKVTLITKFDNKREAELVLSLLDASRVIARGQELGIDMTAFRKAYCKNIGLCVCYRADWAL